MKKYLRVFLGIILVAMIALSTVSCPIDNSMGTFTGSTKTDGWGHLWKQYRCAMGHYFWGR